MLSSEVKRVNKRLIQIQFDSIHIERAIRGNIVRFIYKGSYVHSIETGAISVGDTLMLGGLEGKVYVNEVTV